MAVESNGEKQHLMLTLTPTHTSIHEHRRTSAQSHTSMHVQHTHVDSDAHTYRHTDMNREEPVHSPT